MSRLYLDSTASTPLAPEVLQGMQAQLAEVYGNPSAPHRLGIAQRDAIKESRRKISEWLGCKPEEIFFTSGGTEAANLALIGSARALSSQGKHLLIGAGEHPAVWRSAESLQKEGFEISWLPVDADARLRVEEVEKLLRPDTVLIAVQHANHDTGTIQPVEEISRIAREKGIRFFCDASASAGWTMTGAVAMGADLISFSPHHFFGPKGVGILWKKSGLALEPILHGGRQEGGLRAGTENVPAIVGAGIAAEMARERIAEREKKCREIQRRLLESIAADIPYVKLLGAKIGENRLPHHISLSFLCVEGEALALRLDLQGIAVTSVTGCATREAKIPRVLRAMGLADDVALGNVIIGITPDLSGKDVDFFVQKLAQAVEVLRKMSPRWRAVCAGEIGVDIPEKLQGYAA